MIVCRLYVSDCKDKVNLQQPDFLVSQDINNLIKNVIGPCTMSKSCPTFMELQIQEDQLKEDKIGNIIFYISVNKKYGIFKNKDGNWQIKLNR